MSPTCPLAVSLLRVGAVEAAGRKRGALAVVRQRVRLDAGAVTACRQAQSAKPVTGSTLQLFTLPVGDANSNSLTPCDV